MTYTYDSSDIVGYEVVSPKLVLTLFMGDIRCIDNMNNKLNLIDRYHNYLFKLISDSIRTSFVFPKGDIQVS